MKRLVVFLLLAACFFSSFGQTPGTALNFAGGSGGNDYVRIGNPAALQITGNITLECRFRTTGPSGNYRTLVSKWHTGGVSGFGAYSLLWDNTGLSFWLQSSTVQIVTVSTGQNYTDGNWHHVAGTWDGTYARIYVDGVLVNSAIKSGFGTIENNNLPVCIGTDSAGIHSQVDRFFNGDIDEVRIWGRALCQGEILNNISCELPGSQANLAGYYKLNNGFVNTNNSGATLAADASGNGNNGTLINFALSGTVSNWSSGGVGGTCAVYTQPEINIRGNNVDIISGDVSPSLTDHTDFDNCTPGGAYFAGRVFTIQNTGTGNLNLTGSPIISITGANASEFTVFTQPAASVTANGSTTFMVRFTPMALGLRTATISISNNDCDEPVYTFAVQGTGSYPAGALSFDGIDDVVTSPNIGSVVSDKTLSAWVKLNTLSQGGGGLVSYEVDNGSVFDAIVYNETGQGWGFGSNGFARTAWSGVQETSTAQWVHIVATYSNGIYRLYRNGTQILQTTSFGIVNYPTNSRILIGKRHTGGSSAYLNGQIDEVSVWNRALCPTEVQALYNASCELNPSGQTGLMALYHLNHGFANSNNTGVTFASDYTGNGRTGTLTGFTLTGTTSNWVTGNNTGTCGTLTQPEINVKAYGVSIVDGDNFASVPDSTDFSNTGVGTGKTRTFTIENTGTQALSISSITTTGTAASDFIIGSFPSSIAAGSSGTFTVTFAPTVTGNRPAKINIFNNDCDEAVYDFAVQGLGATLARALNFDGVNDNITVPDNATFDAIENGDAVTAEAWINISSSASGWFPIIDKYEATGDWGWSFLVNATANTMYFDANSAQAVSQAFTFSRNTWYHVAVSYSKALGVANFYVNGNLVGSPAFNGDIINTTGEPLYIGASPSGSDEYAMGNLDEVRLWSRALCQAEIQNNMNCELGASQNGLVGYYQLNSGLVGVFNSAYTTATDASGNNNNGALNSFLYIGNSSNWVAGTVGSTTCAAYAQPEINLKGNNISIVDGDVTPTASDHTDFGPVISSLTRTFTIENTGNANLSVSSIALSGANAADYAIGGITLPATVAANSNTSFSVTFTPSAPGNRVATLTVNNADCDEPAYDYVITGAGLDTAGALDFDGSNDAVFANDANQVDFTTQYTAEAMIYVKGYQYGTIVAKFEDDGNNRGWMINMGETGDNTKLCVVHSRLGTWTNPIQWNTGFTPALNTWYHIAVTFDATLSSNNIKLYVNGNLQAQTTWAYSMTPNLARLYIGGYDGPGNGVNGGANSRFFNGKIDEVRLFNRPLCQDEINTHKGCTLAGNENGLVAYYKFKHGFVNGTNTGITTLTDVFGNNGTLTNFALSGTTSNWTTQATGVSNTTCSAYLAPEIDIKGNSVSIADGDNTPNSADNTDFGGTGTNVSKVFTIENTGSADLTVSSITMSGTHAADYTISGITLPATIPASSNATFTITFSPSAAGIRTSVVTINNSDCDEPSYDFALQGTGLTPATALHFNGWGNTNPGGSNINPVFDYITVPDNGTMDLGDKYTIEAKVFLDDNSNNTIIDKGNYRFLFQTHPNGNQGLGLYNNNMGWKYSSGTVPTGQWIHIAVAFDVPNNTVTFYLNGNVLSTHSGISNGGQDNGIITIGRQEPSGCQCNNFDGKMDELRVWNRVLCQAEIQANMNCELNPAGQTGLLALYNFNQGYVNGNNASVTTATDASGNGNNGTLTSFALTGATSNWAAGTLNGSCAAYAQPEINVSGNNVAITSGDITPSATDHTDFGGTNPSVAVTRTFTIANTGTSALNISSIGISGVNTSSFAVGGITTPVSIAAGNSINFTVTFNETSVGVKTAKVVIGSNDCDESSYNYAIQGEITCSPAGFTACPSNISANAASGLCSQVVSYTAAANGTPAPAITYTFSGATTGSGSGTGSGSTFNIGVTTVTINAANSCSNVNCSFTVTVADNQMPQLAGVPADLTVNCESVPAPAAVTAMDNCNSTLPVSFSQIITSGAMPTNGLKGAWTFNEGTGSSTADQSGNGNNGALTSGVSWVTGQSGSAVQMSGTGNDYVQINNGTGGALDTRNAISMFAWYVPGTNGSQQNPIIQYNENGWGTHMWQTGSNQLFVRFTSRNSLGFTTNLAANSLVPGQWNCVGATYDSTTGVAKLWCNGVNVQTLFIGQMQLSTNHNLRIGSVNFDGRRTNSKVDNVVIYNRELTQAEISTLCAVSCPQSYTITRIWSATDPSNNTTIDTQKITVIDTTKPLLTVPANIALTTQAGLCTAVATYTATATDNCSNNLAITYSHNSGYAFPKGATPVTVTAKDECGNTTIKTFTVTVTDNEAPVVVCSGNISVSNDAGVCGAVVNYTAPVGADNCPGATTVQVAGLAGGSLFPIGTTTNTFVVTDASGNRDTCSFTVTVTDNQAPVIACPGNIYVNNDAGICGAVVNYTAPVGTDNCPGVTTAQVAGLATGATFPVGTTTNTFVVTDAYGNKDTCSFTVTVTDTEVPTISIAGTTVNADNGQCYATNVNLGTPSIADNCAVDSVWNNAPSSYNVGNTTVTWNVLDIHGNTNSTTQTVTVNDNQAPVVITQNITVYLGASGTAFATAAMVNNVSTDNCGIDTMYLSTNTFDCSDIGANTVTLTVVDIHNNSAGATATVTVADTVKPVIACPADITVSCLTAPSNTGTATATDACGVKTITYTDASNYSSNPADAAHYNYTITRTWTATDSSNNSASCTQVITVQQLKLAATVTNVACYGGNNGSIDLSVQGGVGTLSYSWTNSATSQDINGLVVGNYTVTVTDGAGCIATASYSITQPTPLVATAIAMSPNPTVSGQPSNTIYLGFGPQSVTLSSTASGGTPGYTYSWAPTTGVANPGSATTSVSPFVTTTYTLTITDSKGCIKTVSKTIYVMDVRDGNNKVKLCHNGNTISVSSSSVQSHLNHGDQLGSCFEVDATKTKVSCYGGNDGSINATVYGGVPPFSYSWSNGATTEDLAGLTAGSYTITVTAANGATTSGTFNVQQYSKLDIDADLKHVKCFGDSTGKIEIDVDGGNDPYTYLWNNGSTGKNRSNLPAGTYMLTVKDDNGCIMKDTFTITQPASPIVITGVVTHVKCNGDETGKIDITVTGGTGSYSYDWDDNSSNHSYHNNCHHSWNNHWCNHHNNNNWCNNNSQDLTNVDAGSYTVTVRDGNGCEKTATFTITEPAAIAVTTVKTNPACYGGNNGTIDITAGGGVAPYSYRWNDNVTTEDRSGLTAGTYSVQVTDANGCKKTVSVTITQPAQMAASAQVTGVSCNGGTNGSINLTVTGGTKPYTYLWSNNATTQDIGGLTTGTYTVAITDSNGCTLSKSATVTQPAALSIVSNITHVSCNGDDDGKIDITVTGGSYPYTYKWDNNSTQQDRQNLSAGNYSLTVKDANGCTKTVIYTVNQPSAITVSGTVVNPSCYNGNNGSITLNVTGGTAPYTYKWNNNSTNKDRTGLSAGSYTVKVKDAEGCEKTVSFNLTQPSSMSASITVNPNPTVSGQSSNTIYKGYGPQTVTLTVGISGGATPYTFSWIPSAGISNPNSASVAVTPASSTTYTVTVTDANGCTKTATKTITVTDVRDGEGVEICHDGRSLTVAPSAVAAHLAHGDQLGDCHSHHKGEKSSDLEAESADTHQGKLDAVAATLVGQMKVHPNPTTGKFYVELPKEIAGGEACILDMSGKTVRKVQFNPYARLEFDLADIAAGVYMVQVKNGNDIYRALITISR